MPNDLKELLNELDIDCTAADALSNQGTNFILVRLEECRVLSTEIKAGSNYSNEQNLAIMNAREKDLLLEHEDRDLFSPTVIEGVSFEIENHLQILEIRKKLPKTCEVFLYSSFVSDHPPNPFRHRHLAILAKRISDDRFLKFRRTSAINCNLNNLGIRAKVWEWANPFDARVVGATLDALYVQFRKFGSEAWKPKLIEDIIRFCPDIESRSDVREDLLEKLNTHGCIDFWWD